MILSLLGDLMRRWARAGRRAAPPGGGDGRRTRPRLEALEDRCLPTFVPHFPVSVPSGPVSVPVLPAAVHALPSAVHSLSGVAQRSVSGAIGLQPLLIAANVGTVAQGKTDPQVVFLGDSITWGFEYGAGAGVWSSLNADGSLADYGVGGQTTQGLLFQLGLGQLSGIHPQVVVLTIGTNNLLHGESPQDTAAGIMADVGAVHLFAPQAQILVLGVPPGHGLPGDPYRRATVQTDAIVSQDLAGDPRATYVNIAPALESPGGLITPLTLSDFIHPTALGYLDISLALFTPLHVALLKSVPHVSLPHR